MQPSKMSIYELFEKQTRYVVPLFQRPYVWGRENQWEPLWEDISNKARQVGDRTIDRRELSSHFLGAAVLHAIPTFGRQVAARQIIDGQQRLTTLQILLVALRDFARLTGADAIASDLAHLTINSVRMEQPFEKYKVWPTTADQTIFEAIHAAGSPEQLWQKYPLVRVKYSNSFKPRPRLVEAYLYFYQAIEEYVLDVYDNNQAVAVQVGELSAEQEERIDALMETIQKYLELVVIDLEERDDPQVIFETLNARGVPLLPSDLIRNYVFLEATNRREDAAALYDALWKPYDINDSFWQKEERQGRLFRPRIDLFMYHFLTFKTERFLNITQLFDAFRVWWQASSGRRTTREQLEEIAWYSRLYQSFFDGSENSRLGVFVRRLQLLDTSTVFPLLLFLYGEKTDIDPVELEGILDDIESYLVRRLVCRLTTQGYNRFFVGLLKQLRKEPVVTRQVVRNYMLESQSAAVRFPSDTEFYEAWCRPVYGSITGSRVSMILEALDLSMITKKQEQVHINSKLTIEHVRPQRPSLERDWSPLPDEEINIIHTFGNLTLLTGALNTTISNGSFAKKRPEIAGQSVLRLNTYFQKFTDADVWTLEEIKRRTDVLFDMAKGIWTYPGVAAPVAQVVATPVVEAAPSVVAPVAIKAPVVAAKDAPDDEVYRYLQQVAREEQIVPYIDIARMLYLDMQFLPDRNELSRVLGAISTYEHEQGRPMLSAVVVFSNEGAPGGGFYELAGELGKFTGQTEDEKLTFFVNELNAVYQYWKATEG